MGRYNENAVCQYFSGQIEGEAQILNFVYEYVPSDSMENDVTDCYCMYMITQGEGTLFLKEKAYHLKKGDMFLLFPDIPYKIKNDPAWKIMYVSFFGPKISCLLKELNLEPTNCICRGTGKFSEEWRKEFYRAKKSQFPQIIVQSILWKSLSYFESSLQSEKSNSSVQGLCEKLSVYLDQHFSDEDISLKKLSEVFHFHINYISYTFKGYAGMGINKYITQKRMAKACRLLRSEQTTIKNIARKCGYRDEFYFERVFKKYYCVTPSQFKDTDINHSSALKKDSFAREFYI